jgi:hypothetical protein
VAVWHTVYGGVENILDRANRLSRRVGKGTDISRYEKWEAWISSPIQDRNKDVSFVRQRVRATMTGPRLSRLKRDTLDGRQRNVKKVIL